MKWHTIKQFFNISVPKISVFWVLLINEIKAALRVI